MDKFALTCLVSPPSKLVSSHTESAVIFADIGYAEIVNVPELWENIVLSARFVSLILHWAEGVFGITQEKEPEEAGVEDIISFQFVPLLVVYSILIFWITLILVQVIFFWLKTCQFWPPVGEVKVRAGVIVKVLLVEK